MAEILVEDERQRRITRAAALSMGQWLIEAKLTGKRVADLHMHEMEAIATAAITGYINQRAIEAAADDQPVPVFL